MNTQQIIVNGCYNCPFRNEDNEFGNTCNLSKDERNGADTYAKYEVPDAGVDYSSYYHNALPQECPLRTQQFTVSL